MRLRESLEHFEYLNGEVTLCRSHLLMLCYFICPEEFLEQLISWVLLILGTCEHQGQKIKGLDEASFVSVS